ncbi:MAG: uroporphyrinogen-III C-methyltransferase [Gammaproteobacteria bacterium]|nr:uroporphyrinogen-III C-methyltransferase [Gammaproteobacteria bacterium]MCP5136339.1 uroporphyrinogen-III C-methyltransferase [Gammaproteobacteria bacterium]
MTDKPLKDDLLDDLPAPSMPADPVPSDADEANKATSSGPGIGLWLSGIALILSVGLMAGGLWLWSQYQDLLKQQEAVAARSGEGLRVLHENIDGLTSRIDQQVLSEVEAIRSEQKAMDATQVRLRDSFNEVRSLTTGDRKPLVLAETEYLLKLANERLTFMFDAETAITALRSADAGLAALDDPALIDIRSALAHEIGALQALPHPDISGMAVRIADLGKRVDSLPLPGRDALRGAERRTDNDEASTGTGHDRDWREAANKVWSDLRKLVVVRHQSRDQHEILSPRESYFLRENLRLKLESARLSLLQREPEAYRDDLSTARAWIDRYFLADSVEVAQMLYAIDDLATAEIKVQRPDIGGSLRQVRLLRARLIGTEAGLAKAQEDRNKAAAATEHPASIPPVMEPAQ